MFFSVVIPTHKRKEQLQRLLLSLEQQTLAKDQFEVIVVRTAEDPAFELESSLSINFSISFKGIAKDPYCGKSASAKRNHGVEMALAPWIAFIDDDCVADPQWLEQAQKICINTSASAVEGHTLIPPPPSPTLSYKGLKRLSRPKGYQTCNMFYKKEAFKKVGGFDPAFPFYLEDTDLAWSILENFGEIPFCEKATVEHPVGEPVPKRLLSNALRMSQMPYLYKKHRMTFKNSNMRVYPRPYLILLLFDLLALSLVLNPPLFLLAYGFRLFLTGLYIAHVFRGCTFYWWEIGAVFFYTLICPLVGIFQLIRGNIQQRTFLFSI